MIFCYVREYDKLFLQIPKELQEKYRGHLGKVACRFVCDRIDEYAYDIYDGVNIDDDDLLQTCHDREEINIYAKGKTIYGIHITDLEIYDAPKDWYGFLTPSDTGGVSGNHYLSRPPYSWQYVETF